MPEKLGSDMQPMHEMASRRLPRPVQTLLHRWFLLRRGMTLGVRAVVIEEAARVLLVRHTYAEGWHFPGGGVEVGETLEDALHKELREDAGLALAGPAALHGVFLNERMGRRDHVAVFVARAFTWQGPPPPTREIAAADFFPLDALPEGTTPGTRARLAEILEGRPPARLW